MVTVLGSFGSVEDAMSPRSDSCDRCLVTNDGHPSKFVKTRARAGVPCQQTPARSKQAKRARVAGIADKP